MRDANKEVPKIGLFKIGRDIGEGTFGLVKLGSHLLTQEKVIFCQKGRNKGT